MKRTLLKDRLLPNYTKKEEMLNMATHILGALFGIAFLVLCIIMSAIHDNTFGIVSSSIYGSSVIILFTISSIYHGLRKGTAKKGISGYRSLYNLYYDCRNIHSNYTLGYKTH